MSSALSVDRMSEVNERRQRSDALPAKSNHPGLQAADAVLDHRPSPSSAVFWGLCRLLASDACALADPFFALFRRGAELDDFKKSYFQ